MSDAVPNANRGERFLNSYGVETQILSAKRDLRSVVCGRSQSALRAETGAIRAMRVAWSFPTGGEKIKYRLIYGLRNPSSRACAMAAVRLETPNFRRMWLMWLLTVPTVMTR